MTNNYSDYFIYLKTLTLVTNIVEVQLEMLCKENIFEEVNTFRNNDCTLVYLAPTII